MKLTKSQLKQIIKEELNEVIGGDRDVEWLTSDEMRKSPPSASVRRAVGPKKYPETEGEYSMGFEQEEDLENMPDQELMDMAHQDGVEKFIVLDGEGGLANREEIISVLKDIG